MKKITPAELRIILDDHAKWLADQQTGKCADLFGFDLSGLDLSGLDLRYANLHGTKLHSVNGANLSDANLSCADLRSADLRNADLSRANIKGAILCGARLSGAILSNIQFNEYTTQFAPVCPETGSFIAFKKCQDDRIVKLKVPVNAKRSSATTRICRVSAAKVISITSLDGKRYFKTAIPIYKGDKTFVYKVGKLVKADHFDPDRWKTVTTGIHCFITREEAVQYHGNC